MKKLTPPRANISQGLTAQSPLPATALESTAPPALQSGGLTPALSPHADQFQAGSPDTAPPGLAPSQGQQSRPHPQMLAFEFGVREAQAAATQRPEVAALLDTYGIDEPLSRPQERILRWAGELHDMLATGSSDLDATVDKIVQRDARRMVFFLQGALKIYRKQYPELKVHYAAAKELEDTLGAYSRWNGMAAQCDTHDLPSAMHDHFIEKRDAAKARITELLHEQWLPDFHQGKAPAIEGLLSTLTQLQWQSPEDDHEYLEAFFQKRVSKVVDTPYDMDQLQGDEGLHEFRRQLRWLSIYAVALDGKVTLPDADFDAIHSVPNAAVEYPAAPTIERNSGGQTIDFPLELFETNQSLVQAFGEIKDRGEVAEDLAHAFVEVGLGDMAAAEAMLLPKLGDDHSTEHLHKEAKALYQSLQGSGHLEQLKHAFQP